MPLFQSRCSPAWGMRSGGNGSVVSRPQSRAPRRLRDADWIAPAKSRGSCKAIPAPQPLPQITARPGQARCEGRSSSPCHLSASVESPDGGNHDRPIASIEPRHRRRDSFVMAFGPRRYATSRRRLDRRPRQCPFASLVAGVPSAGACVRLRIRMTGADRVQRRVLFC